MAVRGCAMLFGAYIAVFLGCGVLLAVLWKGLFR